MGKLLWLLGGVALTLAVFTILNEPVPVEADGIDRAAGRVAGWGTKQRIGGAGGTLAGKAKQAAAEFLGDEQTANAGAFDQAEGSVRNAAGKAAQAIGSTLHDLNKG